MDHVPADQSTPSGDTPASLPDALQSFLRSHQLMGRNRDTHFIVAYSGGRDSTALLFALAQLRQAETFKITVAYYWHPWRPLQQDLAIIHANCQTLKLPWVMLTPNLTLPHTEAAAREDRYQQLARLSKDLGATAVLTGHHQDDQVETILFRILRGTGLEGLQGIPEIRMLTVDNSAQTVTVARPLLNVPRTQLEAYIQTHQLRYMDDPTNADNRYKRNLIRHQILPAIQAGFPQVQQSLLKLAEVSSGDLDIIDCKITEVWHDVFDVENQSLDEVQFTQLALPFQRRIVKRFLETIGEDVGYLKIEEVIAFITGTHRSLSQPALFSLSPTRFLSLYRNRITVETPEKSQIEPLEILIPSQVSHRQLKATLSILPLTPEQRLKPIDFSKLPDNQIYVDLSKFAGQALVLRSRHTGDRIKPLGMTVPIKLKRFLMNRAIPRFERDKIPLLATDSEVLWAVGVGISNDIRVKDRPTHSILIERFGT